ncbi:YfhO family protein [Erwinia sp. CPCC 100877]|nr:YfhO family protein [Erwinia sp. CPCC 100877]
MKVKTKQHLLFGGSFLLPLVLLGLLWAILGLAPFGGNNLLVSDLGTQYMPFLSAFKHFFQEGNLSFYSFSNALGGSMLPLSAYYLLSPFNFLVLFFSYEQLPTAILFIITLKISLMGSSMFYYLKKTYQFDSWFTLLFSTSYSFCGFVSIYALNFMWLDALILMPLLVLSIQQLWDQKRYGFYALVLFLTIVTNYYMGYMLCIFAVCYSIYWHYRSAERTSFGQFLKEGRLFFVTSFFTGISTSFILLPAIQGMLATNKTNFNPESFLLKSKFGFGVLSQFSLGSVNFDVRLDHLPTLYSGLLMVLLLIAYFQLPTISFREKRNAFLLLGFIFLSFWLELFNTVWHMFQSPAGFPYRNTFIFSFLMIKFAYEALIQLKRSVRFAISVPLLFTGLLLIGFFFLNYVDDTTFTLANRYFLVSLLSVWALYIFLSLCLKTTGNAKKLLSVCVLLVLCFELVFNFWVSLKDIPFGNQKQFAAAYQVQSSFISELEEQQSVLFRMKQTVDSEEAGYREKNNGYNNPLLYGYAGVSSYTSTLDAKTQKTLQTLGLYQKNDRRIAYVDESKVVNMLLNVAYQITPEIKARQKSLMANQNANIYQNDEAIGMGFLVPDSFATIKLAANRPLQNQEQILQQIKPGESYFKESKDLQWHALTDNDYTLTAQTAADGELYLYAPNINWKRVLSFKVNGKTINPTVYIATNQVFNLGYFKKDTVVSLEFKSEKQLAEKQIALETLQKDSFDSLISDQRKQALQLNKVACGQLSGTITVNDPQQSFLYLAIPYDKNWQITVDGKKVQTKPVIGNFTGFKLPVGTHHITMTYYQKDFFIGALISISTLFGLFFYQVYKKVKRVRSRSH